MIFFSRQTKYISLDSLRLDLGLKEVTFLKCFLQVSITSEISPDLKYFETMFPPGFNSFRAKSTTFSNNSSESKKSDDLLPDKFGIYQTL